MGVHLQSSARYQNIIKMGSRAAFLFSFISALVAVSLSNVKAEQCEDAAPACVPTYCQMPGYEQFMKDNCFKTCGYCEQARALEDVRSDPCRRGPRVPRYCRGRALEDDRHTDERAEESCRDRAPACVASFCNSGGFIDMKYNCAKTCGFCKTPTKAPAKPEPKPPTEDKPATKACADEEGRNCKNLTKNKNMCASKQWRQYMKDHCPESCGYCAGNIPTMGPTPAKVCSDNRPNCKQVKAGNKNICTSKQWQQYMKDHCAKTCGFC